MEKAVSSQEPQCPTPSTTFVQADATTFRELVQRLTGASEDHTLNPDAAIGNEPSLKPTSKRSTFKLYERRQCPRPKLQIVKPGFLFKPAHPVRSPSRSIAIQPSEPFLSPPIPIVTAGFSTSPAVLSPTTPSFITSPLGTPSQSFSNLTLFEKDRDSSGGSCALDLNREEEERAIKERRFYLHPSPRSRPGISEPELLSLFPLTSPKTHESE